MKHVCTWKLIVIWMILLLPVLPLAGASAEYRQQYNGYTYSILLNGTLIIEKYDGGYADELIIPDVIDHRKVTQIGYGGFNSCKAARIVIPDGLTFIGYDGFIYASMSSIEIPASVCYIDEKAFVCCDNLGVVYCPKGSYADSVHFHPGGLQG